MVDFFQCGHSDCPCANPEEVLKAPEGIPLYRIETAGNENGWFEACADCVQNCGFEADIMGSAPKGKCEVCHKTA